ncbi:MAG TPA: non-canonical purine NTP pyrophosphatase [Acidimicrobiales bacterium]|nr:non-canonical purine NTP pyrophosphatase [Acidimicrobiales bacterium]
MIRRLVVASANPDKAVEIAAIIGAAVPGLEILPRPAELAEVVEDGETLADNARLKAIAVAGATGEAALADDTGLEVEALGGGPGVRSARYAGENATYDANVSKLLAALDGLGAHDAADRRAVFRTVALVRWPDGRELAAEGSVAGTIAPSRRGDRGFGYDPVFVPDEGAGLTYSEMSPEEKNTLSHRGRALRAVASQLGGLTNL